MANSLKIIVKADGGNSNNQSIENTTDKVNTNSNSSAGQVLQSVYTMQMINAAQNMIKSEFNYQISRYGDTTGDYLGQQKLDLAMQRVSMVTNVGMSIGAGFMVGGPIGAAVGAVVSIGSLALNASQEYRTSKLNFAKQNANASFTGSMLGSIISGGNRG